MKKISFVNFMLASAAVAMFSTAQLPAANASIPDSSVKMCQAKDTNLGHLIALKGGRKIVLGASQKGTAIKSVVTTTRAYTKSGHLLWTVDHRRITKMFITATLNKDPQKMPAGVVLVTDYKWIKQFANDTSCRVRDTIPK